MPAHLEKGLQALRNEAEEDDATYLYSSLESQKCVPRITHLEDAPEPILSQISNLQYLQLRRNAPQVQLID